MNEIITLNSVADYNDMLGIETFHPLVSIINYSKMKTVKPFRYSPGFYSVFLKGTECGDIRYGRNKYDYREGTLMFTAPGQVIELMNSSENIEPNYGWALLFHPDLIRGTSLGRKIKEYSFFSYEVHEALHLSEQERQIASDCINKIELEINRSVDKHSKMLIITNIELLLNYCIRFYERQFITRSILSKDIIVRFENILDSYFQSEKPQTIGLPSVKYCAEQLHLSPNYFGDLIKKETGKSAQEHIRIKLIETAKERIFDRSKSISEIAYELGFKYSQHFSKLFKHETGYTPGEYRMMN